MPNNPRAKKLLIVGFALTFFYGLQLALLVYVLSDYLGQYMSAKYISLVYISSAIFSLYILNVYNKSLKHYHNYRTTSTLILLQIFSLAMMSFVTNPFVISFYTLIYLSIVTLLATSLNLYIDEWAEHEDMGVVRGVNMVITALSLIFGLFLSKIILSVKYNFTGLIVSHINHQYGMLIIVNIFILVIMQILVKHYYSHISEPKYAGGHMWKVIWQLYRNKDLYGVFIANLALQFYVTIMIAYFVTYLIKFNFVNISEYVGYIMPLALLPFVLLPYKVGQLADKKYGEKEFMIAGLVIMSISMLLVPILSHYNSEIVYTNLNNLNVNISNFNNNISHGIITNGNQIDVNNINGNIYSMILLSWGILLIIGRTGSSLLETASTTYFFKKVSKNDNDTISLFSNLGALGTLIASLFAIISYYIDIYFNINYSLFILSSAFLLLCIRYVMRVRDTL